MDGWNTTFLFGRPIFRGYVSFREGRMTTQHPNWHHTFLSGFLERLGTGPFPNYSSNRNFSSQVDIHKILTKILNIDKASNIFVSMIITQIIFMFPKNTHTQLFKPFGVSLQMWSLYSLEKFHRQIWMPRISPRRHRHRSAVAHGASSAPATAPVAASRPGVTLR